VVERECPPIPSKDKNKMATPKKNGKKILGAETLPNVPQPIVKILFHTDDLGSKEKGVTHG